MIMSLDNTQQSNKHDLVYKIITHIVFLIIGILIGFALKQASL